MLSRALLSFGFFAAVAMADTTSSSAAAAASGASGAGTCFWFNGTAAASSQLLPCKTSLGNDGFFACCPPQGANDLYPLDYPVCTENGLCKAGNSDFMARGGCTDKTGKSKSCPQYCPTDKKGGMAGLTNCGTASPYFCCNADHDSGACNCSPPNGTAFQMEGTSPLFWSSLQGHGNSSSHDNHTHTHTGDHHTGTCDGTVHMTKTTTVVMGSSTSTPAAAVTPPQPTSPAATAGSPAGGASSPSASVKASGAGAQSVVDFGLALFAAGAVMLI